MSFVSSRGNILCRLIKIELYKIFAIINRAIKGLHCNLSNFLYCRNHTSYENFKIKLRTCAQSHALGTCRRSQLEILTINVFSDIAYFRGITLESSRNFSKTIPRALTAVCVELFLTKYTCFSTQTWQRLYFTVTCFWLFHFSPLLPLPPPHNGCSILQHQAPRAPGLPECSRMSCSWSPTKSTRRYLCLRSCVLRKPNETKRRYACTFNSLSPWEIWMWL